MSIYSNDNIRKIAKLTTRELPQKSKNAKITVRENNGLYSIARTKLASLVWEKKIQGLSPWNTDHARRVPTFKSMFQLKKYLENPNIPWSCMIIPK